MKKYVDIRVSTDQMKSTLRTKLSDKCPYKEVLVDAIIDTLAETEMGLSNLYNAFSGVIPTVHVKIGDDVLVSFDHLPTWRMDRERMREAGHLERGYVKCTVKEIHLQRRESIIVQYTACRSDNSQEEVTYSLNPESVHLNNEEYPEGF